MDEEITTEMIEAGRAAAAEWGINKRWGSVHIAMYRAMRAAAVGEERMEEEWLDFSSDHLEAARIAEANWHATSQQGPLEVQVYRAIRGGSSGIADPVSTAT